MPIWKGRTLGLDCREMMSGFKLILENLILYQGHYMVIYYDRNSYSLTRLGKIINVTQDELKNALGKGNVSVVLSLE